MLSGFKIYREDCSLAVTSPVLLTSVIASQFQYTDSTVTGGKPYKFYVTAYNALGGESLKSDPLPITPIQEPDATAAPVLVDKGKDFIIVNWTAPASDGGAIIERYVLYARADYDSTYHQVYSGIAFTFKTTSKQFPSLLRAGFNYDFKVASVNKAGMSLLSPASA